MQGLTSSLADLRGWWTGLPPLPDLNLPAPWDADLLLVAATLAVGLGLVGLISAWVETRLSRLSLALLLVGCATFFWVWETDRGAFGLLSIPQAFVETVARAVR